MSTSRSPRQDHRDALKKVMARVQAERLDGAFHGYLGGYCDNKNCDVRAVLLRVKGYNDSVREIRCPACRDLLLLGAHEFETTALSTAGYDTRKKHRARRDVAHQLQTERKQAEWPDGLVIFSGPDWEEAQAAAENLDGLAKLFREREERSRVEPAQAGAK